MTGPKLNERSFVAGEKTGSKAVARWVRMSALKARPVLDLIRDKDVQTADEILKFTTREAAHVIRKVLASAVANAVETTNSMPRRSTSRRASPTRARRSSVSVRARRVVLVASTSAPVTSPSSSE